MLELSWNGKKPLEFDGMKRTFIEDGDTIIMTGGQQLAENGPFIGFGEVSSTYLA